MATKTEEPAFDLKSAPGTHQHCRSINTTCRVTQHLSRCSADRLFFPKSQPSVYLTPLKWPAAASARSLHEKEQQSGPDDLNVATHPWPALSSRRADTV